jgi:hypothetical protein
MSAASSPKNDLSTNVVVPEKYFLKWMHEQSSIAKLKIWCDFGKESLPYITH